MSCWRLTLSVSKWAPIRPPSILHRLSHWGSILLAVLAKELGVSPTPPHLTYRLLGTTWAQVTPSLTQITAVASPPTLLVLLRLPKASSLSVAARAIFEKQERCDLYHSPVQNPPKTFPFTKSEIHVSTLAYKARAWPSDDSITQLARVAFVSVRPARSPSRSHPRAPALAAPLSLSPPTLGHGVTAALASKHTTLNKTVIPFSISTLIFPPFPAVFSSISTYHREIHYLCYLLMAHLPYWNIRVMMAQTFPRL